MIFVAAVISVAMLSLSASVSVVMLAEARRRKRRAWRTADEAIRFYNDVIEQAYYADERARVLDGLVQRCAAPGATDRTKKEGT